MLEAKDRQGQPVARFGPQQAGRLTCFQIPANSAMIREDGLEKDIRIHIFNKPNKQLIMNHLEFSVFYDRLYPSLSQI